MRTRWIAAVTLGAMTGLSAGPATAGPALLTQAKDKGYPAQGCQYCHTSAPPALNDRGKWLETQKTKHSARAVDVDWLKTYPGDKEQKR
jgi:hypothetical protein